MVCEHLPLESECPAGAEAAMAERWGQGVRIKNSSVHSVLPVQGGWVRTLVREVRSHMPCGMAKKKKKKMVSLVPDPQLHGGRDCCVGV